MACSLLELARGLCLLFKTPVSSSSASEEESSQQILILASYNPGLRWTELFSSTPVVFCGANFFEDQMLAAGKNFTGVVEAFDLPGTISLMLKLHPNTEQIVIVNDRTTTGKANQAVMNQTLPRFGTNVSFVIWDDIEILPMIASSKLDRAKMSAEPRSK